MEYPPPTRVVEKGRTTRTVAALLLAAAAAGATHWAWVEWELHQALTHVQAARGPAVAPPAFPQASAPQRPIVVVDWSPPIALTEDAHHYIVQVNVSDEGVTTLHTELQEADLTLSGTRLINRGTLSDAATPRSSVSVQFEEVLHFPSPVEGPPHAAIKKGVLTLTLHKFKPRRSDRVLLK